MAHGVFPVTQRGVSNRMPVTETENWKIDKRPPRTVFSSTLINVGTPVRVSRSIAPESPALRAGPGRESSIVYDPAERRFVNSNAVGRGSLEQRAGIERTITPGDSHGRSENSPAAVMPGRGSSNRVMTDERAPAAVPPAARVAMPPRSSVAPPPVPRSAPSSTGAGWGGSAPRSSGGYNGGSMPRASGGGSAPSGGARSAPAPSGGRPH